MRISDNPIDDQYQYVKIIDFKDKIEYEVIRRKIQLMLKEWQTVSKVFGQ